MPKRPTDTPPNSSQSMPKKQRTTKRAVRKAGKPNYRLYNALELYRPLGPRTVIPTKKTTVLKYCEAYVNIDPGVGSSAAYVFSCNDVYDPNYTGTGHQPTGFDQWMSFYNRFVVLGSKIKATFSSLDAETLDTVVGIAIFDGPSTTTTTEKYMEQPQTSWSVLPAGSGANPTSTVSSFDLKTYAAGVNLRDNDLLQGNQSASPSRKWYFHVFAGATGAAENPSAVKATVEIEYLVQFFEPKTLDLS